MPTAAELIAARLSATGMDAAFAERLTKLILKDLRTADLSVVHTHQLEFIANELFALRGNFNILADAWQRMEKQRPA